MRLISFLQGEDGRWKMAEVAGSEKTYHCQVTSLVTTQGSFFCTSLETPYMALNEKHANNNPQLVLLAMGFLGPQKEVLEQLGVEQERGTV